MSLSAEFGELIPAQPLGLSSYMEGRISEIRYYRDLLLDYLPDLIDKAEENPELQSEISDTGYWIWRNSIYLVGLERADVRLSRGDPSPALQMLHEEIADINYYVAQCTLKGCKETASVLINDINALRQITY